MSTTLLQLESIEKHLGTQVLFNAVSLSIHEGEKIGFIGRNGAGKSTLLRIMTGEEQADRGRVLRHEVLRLGYLEQHIQFFEGETVTEFLERQSGKPRWECAKMAGEFDLKHHLLETPLLSLSGGYQMRARLAAVLLRDPNLLLLDEPTNYLDVQTQLLLETFLQTYRGSFVIVSHDREFLKHTCTHTLELDQGDVTIYPGDIEEYLAYRDEVMETKMRFNKSVELQKAHLQEFVDRFRAKASKATQAQSKMKQIAKLKTIEIKQPLRGVSIHIPQVEYRNSFAIRATHFAIGYGERLIADDIDFEIQRGEHVAVVGENGQGKSTLLKTLSERIPHLGGTFTFGNKLKVAYFDQHVRSGLHPDETVEDYLTRCGSDLPKEEIMRMAGDFLFRDDDLKKRCAILSGGEAARLCLAGMFLARHDVLLLDEPTNHLDFETVEALAQSLQKFKGTILFVSHSRTFTNLLATSILEVGGGRVRRYPGTYEEYVYSNRERLQLLPKDEIDDEPVQRTKADIHSDINTQKKLQKKLEKQMEEYEDEKKILLEYFASHPLEFSRERNERIVTLNNLLEFTEDEWLKAQNQIEHFEHELRRAAKSSLPDSRL